MKHEQNEKYRSLLSHVCVYNLSLSHARATVDISNILRYILYFNIPSVNPMFRSKDACTIQIESSCEIVLAPVRKYSFHFLSYVSFDRASRARRRENGILETRTLVLNTRRENAPSASGNIIPAVSFSPPMKDAVRFQPKLSTRDCCPLASAPKSPNSDRHRRTRRLARIHASTLSRALHTKQAKLLQTIAIGAKRALKTDSPWIVRERIFLWLSGIELL